MKSGLSVTLNLQLHFKLHLYYSLIEVCIQFPTNSTFSCYIVSIIIIAFYTFIQLRLCESLIMNAFELQWSQLYTDIQQLAAILLFPLVYTLLESPPLTDTWVQEPICVLLTS